MWHRTSAQDRQPVDDDVHGAVLVDDLLAGLGAVHPGQGSDDAPTADCRSKLQSALAAFRSSHASGVYSAKRTIDPLLDVWALAAAVDRNVARPIEAELVTLAYREIVTSHELAACMDGVEAALAPLAR